MVDDAWCMQCSNEPFTADTSYEFTAFMENSLNTVILIKEMIKN